MILKEDPDQFYSHNWRDEGAVCFSFINGHLFWTNIKGGGNASTKNNPKTTTNRPGTHFSIGYNLLCDIKKGRNVPYLDAKFFLRSLFESGLGIYPQCKEAVQSNFDLDTMLQIIADSTYSFLYSLAERTRETFTPCGRMWPNEGVIAFWHSSYLIEDEHVQQLSRRAPNVGNFPCYASDQAVWDFIQIYPQHQYELYELRGKFPTLKTLMSGRAKKTQGLTDRDRELMKRQHLDPQAKKELRAKAPVRLSPLQAAADKRGITVAQLKNELYGESISRKFTRLFESPDGFNTTQRIYRYYDKTAFVFCFLPYQGKRIFVDDRGLPHYDKTHYDILKDYTIREWNIYDWQEPNATSEQSEVIKILDEMENLQGDFILYRDFVSPCGRIWFNQGIDESIIALWGPDSELSDKDIQIIQNEAQKHYNAPINLMDFKCWFVGDVIGELKGDTLGERRGVKKAEEPKMDDAYYKELLSKQHIAPVAKKALRDMAPKRLSPLQARADAEGVTVAEIRSRTQAESFTLSLR